MGKVMMYLFMLEAGAAAGTGWNLMLLCGIQQLLLQHPVEVLEVGGMWRGLVVQLLLPDVVVVLRGLLLCLTPLQSGGVVVLVVVVTLIPAVGTAVCTVFVMLTVTVHAVAVAVLVHLTIVVVEPIVKTVLVVAANVVQWLLGVQWGPLALRSRAVLPHLVDEADFGHVVDDEHFGPVWDGLGLSATEMNVHDEDGERGRGCDHGHRGNVIFSFGRKQRKHF